MYWKIEYGGVSAWFGLVGLCLLVLFEANKAEWLNHGGDIGNTRGRPWPWSEPILNSKNYKNLKLRWKYLAGSDITATPAVSDGVVYVPTWSGELYAVKAIDGSLVWKMKLSEVTGLPRPAQRSINTTISRSTPTVVGDLLIIPIYGPASVVAINRFTRRLVWSTRLDPRPLALITVSGTAYEGGFYVGVSSLEVALPAERCCTFRGSMVKLDIRNGSIIWQTYTIPDNNGKLGGYAGGAIWGSSPSIDTFRNLVYVGTGQLYTAPRSVLECQEAQNNNQTHSSTSVVDCVSPDVYANSIIAFDMRSGRMRWGRRLTGYDVFTLACVQPNNPDCPPGPNLDADFGEAPMLLTIRRGRGRPRTVDVVVASQKNGFVWCLDRTDGTIVWYKQAGPGGLEGGAVWGSATDGRYVYTNIVNSDSKPFRLAPSDRITTGGGWVALDANSGEIQWTTPNPTNHTSHGPVTIVGDLLLGGSMAPNGPLYAMNTRNGSIIWSYNTGGSVQGGASVSYGCIYVGNGVSAGLAEFHPEWTRGNSLYAFCINKY